MYSLPSLFDTASPSVKVAINNFQPFSAVDCSNCPALSNAPPPRGWGGVRWLTEKWKYINDNLQFFARQCKLRKGSRLFVMGRTALQTHRRPLSQNLLEIFPVFILILLYFIQC